MTKRINSSDIGRIDPNFKVNDFRQMVNYQTGTNKGYVRFEFCIPLVLLGNEVGSVFLERFLNAAESWRKHLTAPPETTIGFMPHFMYIMS